MPVVEIDVANIIARLQSVALERRLRPEEYFCDFDRLRTGFISASQFKRCLAQKFGVPLNESEAQALCEKYNTMGDGRVCYRDFQDDIDRVFTQKNLETMPEYIVKSSDQILSESGLINTSINDGVSSDDIDTILSMVASHFAYLGLSILTSFRDFDRVNSGKVTRSQFTRGFPVYDKINPNQFQVLLSAYTDPEDGFVNYRALHNDVSARLPGAKSDAGGAEPGSAGLFSSQVDVSITKAETVMRKIANGLFRDRVRPIEYFKDFDKLRKGVVTENQFRIGIMACCGKSACTLQLTRAEIDVVVKEFSVPGGEFVRYKEFCQIVDNSFRTPMDIEKVPTAQVHELKRTELVQEANNLDSATEERVDAVLERISVFVRNHGILLYPFFKDFDAEGGYSKSVTRSQFHRLLNNAGIELTIPDLALLTAKFKSPQTGDINYIPFISRVDPTTRLRQTDQLYFDPSKSEVLSTNKPEPIQQTTADILDVMDKVKYCAITARRRITEYFRDYDNLNRGCVTASQFRQALNLFGVTINEAEFSALQDTYVDERYEGELNYKRFVDEIESVFTGKNMELHPNQTVQPLDVTLDSLPVPERRINIKQSFTLSDIEQEVVASCMERARGRVSRRRIDVLQKFQDYDRAVKSTTKEGHCTENQFYQTCDFASFGFSLYEMQCLYKFYASPKDGVNYRKFMGDLEPSPIAEPLYPKRMEELKTMTMAKAARADSSDSIVSDVDVVIHSIKTQVAKTRLRIQDFICDYDKLRSGRLSKDKFRRALDLCNFGLGPAEFRALEIKYESNASPDFIDYVSFLKEIESAFIMEDLERQPTALPSQFVAATDIDVHGQTHPFPEGLQDSLENVLNRIAGSVRKSRFSMLHKFKDFDRVNIGSVSRSQFLRVLDLFNLAYLAQDEKNALMEKFLVKVGSRNDVHYRSFCQHVESLANSLVF